MGRARRALLALRLRDRHAGVPPAESDADDVFQEVFARTWQHLDKLRSDDAIRPGSASSRGGSRSTGCAPASASSPRTRCPRREADVTSTAWRRRWTSGWRSGRSPSTARRSSTASSPATRATRRSARRWRSRRDDRQPDLPVPRAAARGHGADAREDGDVSYDDARARRAAAAAARCSPAPDRAREGAPAALRRGPRRRDGCRGRRRRREHAAARRRCAGTAVRGRRRPGPVRGG